THSLVIELARSGRLSALRIDHVDGLRLPTQYLERLATHTGVPIVVEKILTGDERLRADWPVVGTTGYETIDDVGGLLVEPHGLDRLAAAGRREGDAASIEKLTVETRRLVAETGFVAETARAASNLGVDTAQLRDVVTRLPRYRTYLDAGDTGPVPRPAGGKGPVESALSHELEETAVWRSIRSGDGLGGPELVDVLLEPEHRDVALRVQQLTAALMAKGVEDTAWYRIAGSLAFCEVGGDPGADRHGATQRWHDRASERVRRGIHGLVPGTTHDTKRAQDVRSRLYALTEMEEPFEEGLRQLRAALGATGDFGDPGEAEFVTRVAAQLALALLPPLEEGSWSSGDTTWVANDVARRLGDALVKGAREAKRRTSWAAPDEAHEKRLRGLADALLAGRGTILRRAFGPVVDEIIRLGALNSLSAVVLRHAFPGVPDCYQGDETWNLSLVDPDNRRPVDFEQLAISHADAEDTDPTELRRAWRDGRIKLRVTASCLRARRGPGGRALAADATYIQLGASGPAAGSVCAFARRATSGSDDSWAVAVVTRLGGRLEALGDDLPSASSYEGTVIILPEDAPSALSDAISGHRVVVRDGAIEVAEVLSALPVALLVAGVPPVPGRGAADSP
ncbi:MAG TPA: hypothetical protein VMD28_00760, partial [Acidimicrobiales bacterium]|nr:hypothetical protein [Acidimicrobiales bacterium]